ncbi:MAG: hypothetical protein LBB04_00525 [Oscillospiraceae bacterium]|jgi:hypothetical protein|nr:hypothetical protein [Oscillospiraceae bacterium]
MKRLPLLLISAALMSLLTLSFAGAADTKAPEQVTTSTAETAVPSAQTKGTESTTSATEAAVSVPALGEGGNVDALGSLPSTGSVNSFLAPSIMLVALGCGVAATYGAKKK